MNKKILCTLWKVWSILLLASVVRADEIALIHGKTGERIAGLVSIHAGHSDFVSLTELMQALNQPCTVHTLIKQCQIRSKKTIVVSAMNPFIRVGDDIRQMPMAVLYQNGQFYAPLTFFLIAIRDALPFPLEYDEAHNRIVLSSFHAFVQGLSIEDKQNGVLIQVPLSTYVPVANVYTSESNGWFYIDIFGGQIEAAERFPINNKSHAVKQTMKVQLSKDAARFGVLLNRGIVDKAVTIEEKPLRVNVALRTQEQVSADLLADLAREREKWKIDLVVIDPGHGGKDPGTIGKSGTYEKTLTLAIAKEIKTELERLLKIKVIMTRDTDVFLPLQERTPLANKNRGKLFISIHVDANPDAGLRGHTVYFMGPAKTDEARRVAQFENSVIQYEDSRNSYDSMSDAGVILAANAQNSFNKESQDFADMVEKQLSAMVKSKSIGVRQAGFYVLYGSSMPNVLIETGFASNKMDEKRLKDRQQQRLIAKAVAQSVKEFKNRYEMVD
jgi:N-acetylmuramoyl-L-alanine amidase